MVLQEMDKGVLGPSITTYIMRQLALAVLVVTAVLTGVVWFAQSAKLLDIVVNGGAPLGMFISLMGLTFPGYIAPILPITFFIAVIFVFNRLLQDSELVVMWAVGVSPWQLIKAALTVCVCVVVLQAWLNIYLTPAANREMRNQRGLIQSQYAAGALREGVFNSVGDNLTVYIRDRKNAQQFRGIMIHDTQNPTTEVTITAREGYLQKDEQGQPRLIIQNGTRQERNSQNGTLNWLEFEQYAVNISALNKDNESGFVKANERPFWQLFHPPTNEGASINAKEFKAEAHQRLSNLLLMPVYTLIALTAIFSGEFNRRGIAGRMILASSIVVLLHSMHLGLLNAIKRHDLLTPIVYLWPFLIALVCAAWLVYPERCLRFLFGSKKAPPPTPPLLAAP